MSSLRFPPPWSVEEADPELDRRCFIVRDANRQAAHLLTRDGARRIAANIAKLPEFLRGPPPTSEA